MSYFAEELGEVLVYVAYLGIGGSGKTTNVLAARDRTDPGRSGKVLSAYDANNEFQKDMWDFVHPERVRGFPVRVNVWWRSGLHFDHNPERYFLGGGLDAAVLVIDSQRLRLEANEDYLAEVTDLVPDHLWPMMVMQYNKRDHADAAPVETLQDRFNPRGLDAFEAVATQGIGVVETLDAVTARIIAALKQV